ncbi:disease resistance protein RPS2 [Cinnamomum micranthum f. kanehirae]|uniref:Disease resistance protein RPS2 n=1 Tax=Cinnamomum micranthum f. kanehirae TaxID=337451 RepID=A0A443N0K4_9MAGN|nr:disease resistance protein RPS2 [Cinnamomum micranthum f. kanehirae]
MVSLTTLDLSGTNLQMLPPSVGNLVNLRGLYLRDCTSLRDLPSQVRLLLRLEVLDLGGTTVIKYLPREIGELIGLKRLIVGFERRFHPDHLFIYTMGSNEDEEWDMNLRVPIGIISKLPLLEELGMYTFCCAEKDQWDDESMVLVVDELCRLERLTYLDFYFPNADCLAHFLHESISWITTRLRRFRFRVGPERTGGPLLHPKHEEWEGCLVYKGGDEISHAAIIETLAHCSFLHLQDHRATQKLSELGMENMNELKICMIKDCHKIETLFDGDGEQEAREIFRNLEKLAIANLSNLRRLWGGQLLPGSLSKLTHLELVFCHSHHFKMVFQLGMIQQVPTLESLAISFSSVEEIIGVEEETSVPYHTHVSNNDNVISVILPNIKLIFLIGLPELVSFCRGVSLEWPSLEYISISDCPKLKSLSFLIHATNIVPPALKTIEAPRSWLKALEWEDDDIKQQLRPLFEINTS